MLINFNFSKVDSKDQVLRIEVYDYNELQSHGNYEGSIEIFLKDLEQQQKIEEWYQLTKKDGSPHDGDIRLKLQFIWSKYQFYSEDYNRLDNELIKNKENRDLVEEFYILLETKFGILHCGKIDKIDRFLDEKPHRREVDLTEIHQVRKSVFVSPKNNTVNRNSIRFTIAYGVERTMKTILGILTI